MMFRETNRVVRQSLFICLSFLLFSGCSGGGTDGNVTLTTDTQGEDPVVVEVPIAYIRRPSPVAPTDLRDPLSFTPGARLFIRERSATSAEDIELTARIADIVAAELVSEDQALDDIQIALDIKDLESSFDGNTLIFAVRAVQRPVAANLENTTWNLWTYDIEEEQLAYVIPSRIKRNEGVESGGGHDIAPSFLPDDRIVFSSTRQVASQARLLNEGRSQLFSALDEDGDDPAAVLHIYDPQQRENEFQQISFNLSHDLDPLVLASGEVVFSRWNNTATNHVSLFRINPDGLRLAPLYGFHSEGSGSNGSNVTFSQPRELPDGRLASIAKPFNSPTLGGNIIVIDTAIHAEYEQPNWLNVGAQGPGHQSLTNTDVRTEGALSPGGQFGSVYALRDGTGRLLVTWSDCRIFDSEGEAGSEKILPCTLQPENENTAPPLYGGWVYHPADGTQRPVIIPEDGSLVTELIAAEPREFSDLIERPDNFSSTLAQQSKGQLRISSVYDFDGEDRSPAGIAQHATPGTPAHESRPARFLRLIQPVPIPDRDVFEIPAFASGVAGGRNFREILGYTPIEPDGSVSLTVPANRPFSFSILDERGRRIGASHRYWLQVGAGEIVQCTGCHDHSSGLPHGPSPETQAPSSNPGAVSLAEGVGFPATRIEELFATQSGETMAEVWDFHRPEDNPTTSARTLLLTPEYRDEWHAAGVTPDDGITDRQYSKDWSDIPLERALVVANFDPQQPERIVINYPDHIEPIWLRVRDARLNSNNVAVENCVGCHNSLGNSVVPAGQLDLTSRPSDINPDHSQSYRELLSQDQEQWINIDNALTDRQRVCTDINEDGEEIITTFTVPISAPASAGSANGSTRFFSCFEGGDCGRPASPPLPENCTEDGGTVVPATRNTVDHTGLLSEPELHLLSEWLDIGGQYYNNPFDARLIEQ